MKLIYTVKVVPVFFILLTLIACPSETGGNHTEGPTINGCPVFPSNNIWNTPVDNLPVDTHSDAYITTIGLSAQLRADFGSGLWEGAPIGIPFVTVTGTQPLIEIHYTAYGEESDDGPFPIPLDAPIEGGQDSDGDRHVIAINTDDCMLYELYDAHPVPESNRWDAACGVRFDLASNDLRPAGWTSADAAGLPIFPGLVRYDEVAAGEIKHAIRFTVPETQRAYVWPARHYASHHTGETYPPMGQRFRLKANYDISGFSHDARAILQALKTYGMMLADNGGAMFISGVPDERWNNDVLAELYNVTAVNFEAVDVSSLMVNSNSAKEYHKGGNKK
jgi:hypothetical protein